MYGIERSDRLWWLSVKRLHLFDILRCEVNARNLRMPALQSFIDLAVSCVVTC